MPRPSLVAGRFYPASTAELSTTVRKLLARNTLLARKAVAVVCPHAGYIYSGELAAKTLSATVIPSRVILLGPNHHGGKAALLSTDSWQTPLGTISTDNEYIEKLLQLSAIFSIEEEAHQQEHSLEVQLPFLQILQPQLEIVPIIFSALTYNKCQEIAGILAGTICESSTPSLLLASSDMSHYLSRTQAQAVDQPALNYIRNLDPSGLFTYITTNKVSMCGYLAVTVALLAAQKLGCSSAHLLGYTDSGEVNGDTSQVVGYAGLQIL